MKRLLKRALMVIGIIAIVTTGLRLLAPTADSGPVIGVIDVTGVISESVDPWDTQSAGTRHVLGQIEQASRDERVHAVVVRINSPGGSPAASQEIHGALTRLRQDGLPVVASMGDMATSAAYYVALAADTIVANPATTTGSIGVILQVATMERLLDRWGIDVELLTSGPFKAAGSPFRPMTPAERQVLMETLEDMYGQFVEAVAAGRGLSVERVRELADGRVYSGRQALDAGLIDELGSFHDALRIATRLAGLEEVPPVIYFRRPPGVWERLLSGGLGALARFLGNRSWTHPQTDGAAPTPSPSFWDSFPAEGLRVVW